MTKRQIDRIARLLPNGNPRWVRIYDNGETFDRYTVLYTGRYTHKTRGEHCGVGMSAHPFHPQGFGQHFGFPYQCDTIAKNGRAGYNWPPAIGRKCHLGKRIPFSQLPPDCKRLVLQDYCEMWDVPTPQQPDPS